MFDDLLLKTQSPNHFANLLEKQATAGAKIPKNLHNQIKQLQELTAIARSLLSQVMNDNLAMQCNVIHVEHTTLTLAVPTITAANHMHYLRHTCLTALRQHPKFEQFCELELMVRTKLNHPNHHNLANQSMAKKPLTENTLQNISHSIKNVTNNPSLQASLIELAKHINVVDDHSS